MIRRIKGLTITSFMHIFLIYWTAMLTVLFAIALGHGTRISITLIHEALGIPGWLIIVAFTVSTIVNALSDVRWQYHILILSPFILYGVLSIFAYTIAANSLITGLISAHLYGGITVTFIGFIAERQYIQSLTRDIERYRSELGWRE